jgi:hypothetical protein
MDKRIVIFLATSTAFGLIGCGGGAGTLPQGTSASVQSPEVRAINLIPGSPALSVQDESNPAGMGSVAAGQYTPYQSEGVGLNTIDFVGAQGHVAAYSGQFGGSTYSTVVVYAGAGVYGTFALDDSAAPTASGTSRVRVANAVAAAQGNANVYITAGSHTEPNTSSTNLVSGAGLPFGSATGYIAKAPGVYTVTVNSALDPTAILLNQVVTLNSATATTMYVEDQSAVITLDDQ